MKNFFKKIAFVLALAMVLVSVAPATANAATKAPSLKKTSKILYIGGDLTGTISDSYRFYFNNAAGYTATWKSKNTKVVAIEGKNVVAVGVGKAEVVATLTNKAGKSVQKTATVWVKQNAEEVGFGSMAAVESPLAVGAKAKINVYRLVGDKKIWTQSDVATCTDVIKWTSSNEKVATVDKFGTVTAVAAGEATITATATQSQGPTAGESASYKVTVAAGIQSVKQTGLNTAEITFAGDLSAEANKGNVTIKSMVGTTGVNVVVKDVKFDKVDKTKAIITAYNEFAKDTEYVVSYKDTSASFVGVDTSKDAVASIKFATTEVVKGVATKIDFKVYDKNGIDITRDEFLNRIEVSLVGTSVDCFLDSASKYITFFNADKTVELKASYHTYTYGTDYKEITIDAVQTIVSKNEATLAVKSLDGFTVYHKDSTPDFTKPNRTISVTDNGTYKVAVKAIGTDDKEIDNSKFTFESSDETVLIISNGVLYPVKEGGAMVIVKYDKTVVDAYTVTIGTKRVVAEVDASLSKATLATNSSDSITLTVKTKDQFGVDRTGQDDVEITLISGPANIAPSVVKAKTEYKFEGSALLKEGNYMFKVTVGNQPRTVSFTVKDAGTVVGSHQFSNTGKSVDTVLKIGTDKTDNKNFSLDLAKFSPQGYKIGDVTIDALNSKEAAYNSIKSATGTAVYVEVTANGKEWKDIAPFISVSGSSVEVKPVVVVSGSYVKAPVAAYYVRAFEVTKTDKSGETFATAAVKALGVGSFNINDTQAVVNPAKNKNQSIHETVELALADKDDVITIKIGDTVYNDKIVDYTAIGGGKTFNIVDVKIAVPVNYDGNATTYIMTVAVGHTIVLK